MAWRKRWFRALRDQRNTVSGYTIAAGALSIALIIRWLVEPWITIPFVTIFPAIIVAGLVGGRIAGGLVAAIGGIISWYLWLEPKHSLALVWPEGWFNAGGYVVTSIALLLLARFLNEALDELERERDRANHLFAELQHRTANVMQNVSALLRQSIAKVRYDPRAVDVLKVAQSRFDAMASIHRRLYEPQSRGASNASILQGLAEDLISGLGASASVQVFADDKELEHRQLFTLCVLVAELIINSCKHAFREPVEGAIAIRLTERNGSCQLEYSDNGPGLPDDFSFDGPSLGGRVMMGLVLQLGGTLEPITGVPGARFVLRFPYLAPGTGN